MATTGTPEANASDKTLELPSIFEVMQTKSALRQTFAGFFMRQLTDPAITRIAPDFLPALFSNRASSARPIWVTSMRDVSGRARTAIAVRKRIFFGAQVADDANIKRVVGAAVGLRRYGFR